MTVKQFCIDFPEDPICQRQQQQYIGQAQPLQPVAQQQQAEPGMGTFFAIVLFACGGIALFKHYAKQSEPAYPAFEGVDVWKQLPPPRETWADHAVDTWAASPEGMQALTQTYPHSETPERDASPPTHHTPESPEFRGESALESRLNRLESLLESLVNQPESVLNQDTDSAKFNVNQGATTTVVERYAELVKEGFSPRGNPIIEEIWGLKPGGSTAYKKAKELRDQLANRLEEFTKND